MSKYIQHDDSEVLIPLHITNIGLLTCQMLLINAYITYSHGYPLQGCLDLCLYLTSLAHWRKIKHAGIERKIDVGCLCVTLGNATYTFFTMPPLYTCLWIGSLLGASVVFYVNEKLFYYQVLQYYNMKINKTAYKVYKKIPFHCFSLEYTNPYTHERELAYYRNVITHGIGLHVWLNLASIYCIVHNPL
jgi:hypothetical protein